MKMSKSLVALLALICVVFLRVGVAQAASITIDQITANDQVSGMVEGLDPAHYDRYKVVFYVHTDQWYLHPYAGQGEGMSWAPIQTNGAWQMRTIQREYQSDSVAALIVARDYPEPNMVQNIRMLPNQALVVKELRHTPDFGKL